jgi:DNA-binding cell septation regulator SpoVG
MNAIVIEDWKPMRRGALLGFARVRFPSGMIVHDVTILTGERGAWASPPSKPMVTRDGTAMKDAAGKIRYSPVIEFTDKPTRTRWSNAVLEAMRAAHPEAFASAGSDPA